MPIVSPIYLYFILQVLKISHSYPSCRRGWFFKFLSRPPLVPHPCTTTTLRHHQDHIATAHIAAVEYYVVLLEQGFDWEDAVIPHSAFCMPPPPPLSDGAE